MIDYLELVASQSLSPPWRLTREAGAVAVVVDTRWSRVGGATLEGVFPGVGVSWLQRDGVVVVVVDDGRTTSQARCVNRAAR